jgi:hypothetical protein
MFHALDLVQFAAFKRERQEIHINRPTQSQVWRITKLMKALERTTYSPNGPAVFRRAGLKMNLRALNEIIDSFTLPDGAGRAEGTGELEEEPWNQGIPVCGFLNVDYSECK